MDILRIYLILLFSLNALANAQISPGKLHQAHARLEGLTQCTQCHSAGNRIGSEKCLACHTIIRDRIQAGQGLHAQPEHEQCERCHVEHHGRDFKLIYWENTQEDFDHTVTGFQLNGIHAQLNCRNCHKPEYIQSPELLQNAGKDLNRTFLGLNSSCTSCHYDEHREQLGNNCMQCHDQIAWKPVPKFNHDSTHFPLTGHHQQVNCISCHPRIIDGLYPEDADFLQMNNIRHDNCNDCHKDIHQGKFIETCQECHNTEGWDRVNLEKFDHNQTGYQLKGKHQKLACSQCHLPGRPIQIIHFTNCDDCHSDPHNGRFRTRSDHTNCDDCHTNDGFSPSTFTIDKHQKTRFKLTGSHLAIPCNACHIKIQTETSKQIIRFEFEDLSCGSCHEHPHRSELDKYIGSSGCNFCHNTEAWRAVRFDHDQTEFPINGRHQGLACRNCHLEQNEDSTKNRIRFGHLQSSCSFCHKDIHGGQFYEVVDSGEKRIRCERCHTTTDWLAERFDHDKDSSFPLTGAHKYLQCASCHKTIQKDNTQVTIYKPLPKSCDGCHGLRDP